MAQAVIRAMQNILRQICARHWVTCRFVKKTNTSCQFVPVLLLHILCTSMCADCFWLLDALLEYTVHGNMPPVLEERKSSVTELDTSRVPLSRREGYWISFYPCVNVSCFACMSCAFCSVFLEHCSLAS